MKGQTAGILVVAASLSLSALAMTPTSFAEHYGWEAKVILPRVARRGEFIAAIVQLTNKRANVRQLMTGDSTVQLNIFTGKTSVQKSGEGLGLLGGSGHLCAAKRPCPPLKFVPVRLVDGHTGKPLSPGIYHVYVRVHHLMDETQTGKRGQDQTFLVGTQKLLILP